MPIIIQNLMISTYGLMWANHRIGGQFNRYVKEAKNREFYNTQQWEKYQTEKLRVLLQRAFVNVPFYQQKYHDAGFKLSDFTNFEIKDLKHIPFLEKEELRIFGDNSLLASNRQKGIFISSSGSTGTPTRIYLSSDFHRKWYAIYEARSRFWAGVDKNTPRGMIGGRRVVQEANSPGPYFRYNFIEKQTYFSAYHISPETVFDYVKGLKKHRVEYMTGYAMSNYLLAKFIEDNKLKVPQMKSVLTSSEKLNLVMRETIERVYQCKVFDSYSGCEACGLITESPEGKLLFSPDSGILELLDENGNEVNPGEIGEIVLSGLHNYDQPLIRYRIGDLAKLSKDQNTVGGRSMPVIDEIIGRIEDVVKGADGRVMVRFHSIFINIEGLKVSQIIQKGLQDFTIKLIIDSKSYNKLESENLILKRMISQLGKLNITFEYPQNINPEANGKIKAVVSQIKNR